MKYRWVKIPAFTQGRDLVERLRKARAQRSHAQEEVIRLKKELEILLAKQ